MSNVKKNSSTSFHWLTVLEAIRNNVFMYNEVTLDPEILNSIPSSSSCVDSPFLYPHEAMLSLATWSASWKAIFIYYT